MNTSTLLRTASIAIAFVLLVACSDDKNNRSSANDSHAMTAEKYALIGMALDRLANLGVVPGSGRMILSDRTSMSHMVERTLEGNETENALTVLDSAFPYDYLTWTVEESDAAFGNYYHANVEPADVEIDDLAVLDRDVSLLMHEQFKAYFAEDEFAGWADFYADYPDAIGYLRLGKPVILEEAGIALMHLDYICDAFCGEGIYVLFRLEGSEWVFTDWYSDWAG
jgi:hypothetical protein